MFNSLAAIRGDYPSTPTEHYSQPMHLYPRHLRHYSLVESPKVSLHYFGQSYPLRILSTPSAKYGSPTVSQIPSSPRLNGFMDLQVDVDKSQTLPWNSAIPLLQAHRYRSRRRVMSSRIYVDAWAVGGRSPILRHQATGGTCNRRR